MIKDTSCSRIAIVGAGPIGLETALRAVDEGYQVDVYERGEVAQAVHQWGHVRMFSPFAMNRSELGAGAVAGVSGVEGLPEDDALLTGDEYVRRYLIPLSETPQLASRIHSGTAVVGVTRCGLLKNEAVGDPRRAETPFRLLLEDSGKQESEARADIVIDASGTYSVHNWLGCGGIPAIGERASRAYISYGLDDVNGLHRGLYAGRRVMLIGNGHSAATSLLALAELSAHAPKTSVYWVTRHAFDPPVRTIENDPLPMRGQLIRRANDLAKDPPPFLQYCPGLCLVRIAINPNGGINVEAVGRDGRARVFQVDRILANVGYEPDTSIYRQLQIHECYATLGPMKLAAGLAADTADCLAQTMPGPEALLNPEPNFFIIGAKSYGRNPSFLIRMGLEQIDGMFSLLRQTK